MQLDPVIADIQAIQLHVLNSDTGRYPAIAGECNGLADAYYETRLIYGRDAAEEVIRPLVQRLRKRTRKVAA